MSYSAQTEKLRLPQWVKGSKDHPDFLTDVNQAFEKIDGFAQGIDNTVDGLPEQVEEVSTILQSVQEDVVEHTEELARHGVQIGILQSGMGDAARLATRVSALEDGEREQNDEIAMIKETARIASVTIDSFEATFNDDDGNIFTMWVSRTGLYIVAFPTSETLAKLTANMDKFLVMSSEAYNMLSIPEGYRTLILTECALIDDDKEYAGVYHLYNRTPNSASSSGIGIRFITATSASTFKNHFHCWAVLVKTSKEVIASEE